MDYFKKGVEIEISSEEEGFRGSWYAGTMIRKLKNNKALVEYKTLMEDDDDDVEQRNFRETVDIVQLRPPPPVQESYQEELKLNEEVDVYFNDGWWEGIITKIHKDGRFTVFFRTNKEEMKFRLSELRLHREWVDNEIWVPPLQRVEENKGVPTLEKVKSTEDMLQCKFNPGTEVEVRSDENGFEGAWFPATIIEQLNKDNYWIQYQSFRNDEDTEFLKEEVDGLNIRPKPPDIALLECLKVFQQVDALFNECWWVGVISEVINDENCIVYFCESKDEMEFKCCDLRVHQDWIDGKWSFLLR